MGSEYLCITTQRETCWIKITSIWYFEVYKRIVVVHYGDKSKEFYSSLNQLEKEFAHLGFIRIHRAYLVNFNYVETISSKEVILQNSVRLGVGRGRIREIMEACAKFSEMQADRLTQKAAQIVGVLVDGRKESMKQSAFLSRLIQELEFELCKNHYHMLLHFFDSAVESLESTATWMVEGMIIIGNNKNDNQAIRQHLKIPSISVPEDIPMTSWRDIKTKSKVAVKMLFEHVE